MIPQVANGHDFVAKRYCICTGLKGQGTSTWKGIYYGLLNRRNCHRHKKKPLVEKGQRLWKHFTAYLPLLIHQQASKWGHCFSFSLGETTDVVPYCRNSGRWVACFGDSCKMSATKMLGMSLIQEKHWGYPLLLWELECGLELLRSKPSQLSTSSQSNGQVNGRNYVCAQNHIPESLCLFFHKHFTVSLKFSGVSVIVQHLAYA